MVKKGLNRPGSRGHKGPIERTDRAAIDESAHRASIGLPPLQRVKRAPGEVNPRRGKSGGLNKSGWMIE
jgi:hypothetical protein